MREGNAQIAYSITIAITALAFDIFRFRRAVLVRATICPCENGFAQKIGKAHRVACIINNGTRCQHVLVGTWQKFEIVTT